MVQNRLRHLLAAFLLTCVAAVSLFAQNTKDLVGKWSMTSQTDSDSVSWTLVIKEIDGHLTAFLANEDGEQPAKDFSYVDGVIKLQAPYQGEDYDIELKFTPGKLEGTWSGGGDSGKTSGVKI